MWRPYNKMVRAPWKSMVPMSYYIIIHEPFFRVMRSSLLLMIWILDLETFGWVFIQKVASCLASFTGTVPPLCLTAFHSRLYAVIWVSKNPARALTPLPRSWYASSLKWMECLRIIVSCILTRPCAFWPHASPLDSISRKNSAVNSGLDVCVNGFHRLANSMHNCNTTAIFIQYDPNSRLMEASIVWPLALATIWSMLLAMLDVMLFIFPGYYRQLIIFNDIKKNYLKSHWLARRDVKCGKGQSKSSARLHLWSHHAWLYEVIQKLSCISVMSEFKYQ